MVRRMKQKRKESVLLLLRSTDEGSMVELAPICAETEVAQRATTNATTAELENIMFAVGWGLKELCRVSIQSKRMIADEK